MTLFFFIMPGISEVVFFHKDFNKIEIFCYRFDYRIVLFVFCFLFFFCLFVFFLFFFSFIRIFRSVYTLHYIITLAYNDIVTIYLEKTLFFGGGGLFRIFKGCWNEPKKKVVNSNRIWMNWTRIQVNDTHHSFCFTAMYTSLIRAQLSANSQFKRF